MPEYIIRWKDSRKQQVHEQIIRDRSIRFAIDYATSLCSANSTDVAVVEDGKVICIIYPD